MTTLRKKTILTVFVILAFASMCLATGYEYDSLNRLSRVVYDDGTQILYSYDASGNRSQEIVSPLADLDTSGAVDLIDFAALASQWLTDVPGDPSADIAPWPNIDGIVDIKDLAKLAEQWLAGAQ